MSSTIVDDGAARIGGGSAEEDRRKKKKYLLGFLGLIGLIAIIVGISLTVTGNRHRDGDDNIHINPPKKIDTSDVDKQSITTHAPTAFHNQTNVTVPAVIEGDKHNTPPTSGGGGGGILVNGCSPKNGDELKRMVEESKCMVITLQPGAMYSLHEEIVVRRAVSVIGNPILLPTIDPYGNGYQAYRAFRVDPGGALDLRFVRVFRGKSVDVFQTFYYEIRGGCIWIRTGGVAVLTGILFTVNPAEIVEFGLSPPQSTLRAWGGAVLLEVGTLTVTDCHFAIMRPGIIFREVYLVGGAILVVGGNLVVTGSTFTGIYLFVNVVGVGNFIAMMGGTAIVTGCVFNLHTVFYMGTGVGHVLFLGGGVSIFTGCVAHTSVGFIAFFGAGIGVFVGGGVAVFTGMPFNTDAIFLATAGIGLNVAQGAGVMIKTGVSHTGNIVANFLATVGIATFIGSGTAVFSETAWVRTSALAAWYGGGGSLYLGSGDATIVNSFGFVANAIVTGAGGGGHIAVMAGWLTSVNVYFFRMDAIVAYWGQGGDILLLAGGAILINTGYGSLGPALSAKNEGLVNIYIAGNDVEFINKTSGNAIATHKVLEIWSDHHGGKEANDWYHSCSIDLRHVGWKKYGGQDDGDAIFSANKNLQAMLMNPLQAWKEGKVLLLEAKAEEGGGSSRRGLVEGEGSGLLNDLLSVQDSSSIGASVQDTSSSSSSTTVSIPKSATTFSATTTKPWTLPWSASEDVGYLLPPVTTDRKSDHVFLASSMKDCLACDVRPGLTSDNFDGAGIGDCSFSDDCDEDEEFEPTDDDDDIDSMWQAKASNTSIGILDLSATYTDLAGYGPPSTDQVESALRSTIDDLGLPSRFKLQVESSKILSPYGSDSSEDDGTTTGGAMMMSTGNCGMVMTYKAHIISDRQSVTNQVIKGLKQPVTAKALTQALGTEVMDIDICSVKPTTFAVFSVPANGLGFPSIKRGASNDDVATALSSSAPAVTPSEDALRQVNEAMTVLAPSVTLLDGEGEVKIDQVLPGQTYLLSLNSFPKARVLSVQLVDSLGQESLPPITFLSRPSTQGKQLYTWKAPKSLSSSSSSSSSSKAAGDLFYLEVATSPVGGALKSDAFAYTSPFSFVR